METKETIVSEESFRYTLPIQIRFNDVDSIGHINNNIYFSYFDLGKISYFENLKASYVSWTDGIIVIAHIDVDFLAPVFYKEQIAVDTKIIKIGNKSVTFLQQIRNTLTNEIKCRCRSIAVTYNPKELAAMKVPQIWKEAISDYDGIIL